MQTSFFTPTMPGLPVGLLVLWGVVWLGVLYRILSRGDLDTLQKILWVIVVIFVPFFGVGLYGLAGPAVPLSYPDQVIPGSDVSGTPWADDPGHRQKP